jgi:REP element-mobilizing transposase RayT
MVKGTPPMTYPRKSLVSIKETPYYHCVARCVRRAWLWGVDEYAGKDYSHRKQWVVDRLRELSMIYAIEVCAFAVMSNHYHTVVFVDTERARQWSEYTVIKRWKKLFRIPDLVQRYQRGGVTRAEQDAAKQLIELWRSRLMDVSWFMRCLNENLARRANAEDGCTGRFWEGRFKSQALLDEAGILTAMAYVDLNPIRAKMVNTPEESEFTSIYERIREIKKKPTRGPTLRRFRDEADKKQSLPCSRADYFTLLDWTGRAIRSDKRGAMNQQLPSILTRLNIDPDAWQESMQLNGNVFGRAMGQLNHLQLHAKALGQQWIKGLRQAERMYRTA